MNCDFPPDRHEMTAPTRNSFLSMPHFDLCGTPVFFSALRYLLIVTCLAVATGCAQVPCGEPKPTITLVADGHVLNVEVAATIDERACGLSHREYLPANHGMLFVYDDERTLTFWMKDTNVPLSIAFLNSEREILEIQKMMPNRTEQRYTSARPARYALEANQGWFASNGISVGTRLDFTLP